MDINLYGAIGNYDFWDLGLITPKNIQKQLKELKDEKEEINVYINSPGGEVFAAQTIYAAFKKLKNKVNMFIDGLCASAMTVITAAGDSVSMHPGALFMIHNPSVSCVGGEAEDLRHTAEVLDKVRNSLIGIYKVKTKLPDEELKEMLNKETWLTAKEAKNLGFIDSIHWDVENSLSNMIHNLKKEVSEDYFEELGISNSTWNKWKEVNKLVSKSNIVSEENKENKEDNSMKNEPGKNTPEVKNTVEVDNSAIEALKKQNEESQIALAAVTAELQAMREEREIFNFKKELEVFDSVPGLNDPETGIENALKQVSKKCPEAWVKIKELLAAYNETVVNSKAFTSTGKDQGEPINTDNKSAYDEAMDKVKELMASDKTLNTATALAKVFEANSELYRKYITEVRR